MGNKNSNLHNAKAAKNDEFYTQLSDIEKELCHYKDHFKDKIVLCNCNDAIHGNFAKYFALNFEFLGLRKLICTSYGEGEENGKICVYKGDKNGNGVPDIDEWEQYELNGKGDFRSEECIKLLEEADIVVTNPPFSLFREFVAQLFEYDKKFLIIGNNEVFPLIKNNQMWLGCSLHATKCSFLVNNDYESTNTFIDDDGLKKAKVNNAIWFTNLDHKKRHEAIELYKKYNLEDYPKYDNYNAIEVSKVCNIPVDYYGVIGVPITFLDKYCPEQFEIIKFRKGDDDKDLCVNGKCPYFRILIKRK